MKILLNNGIGKMKRDIAVLIDFDCKQNLNPIISAVGSESIAREMKKIARRYGIHIEENKLLTDKLQHLGANSAIPEKYYSDLVEIIFKTSTNKE